MQELNAEYGVHTWTMCSRSEWATDEMQRVIAEDNMRGIPLLAFDLHTACPIHPNDCEMTLKGALIKITINLTRQRTWSTGHAANSFFADVAQITVLLPPGYEDKLPDPTITRNPSDVHVHMQTISTHLIELQVLILEVTFTMLKITNVQSGILLTNADFTLWYVNNDKPLLVLGMLPPEPDINEHECSQSSDTEDVVSI
ncbi:hypothetical protein BKA93DRAFT_877098 [Sparassis latifolia]